MPWQLRHHPLRGAIFESWVAAEILKARAHAGLAASLFHFRDAKGLEVDLVVEASREILLVEARSSATMSGAFFEPLRRLAELAERHEPKPIAQCVVFGGTRGQRRARARAVPWSSIHSIDWA